MALVCIQSDKSLPIGYFEIPRREPARGLHMSKPFAFGLSLCAAFAITIACSNDVLAQTKPSATQQLKKANQGETQRGQVYDGRRDQGTVRAAPAQKPSMVGVPASQFRPQVHVKPASAPPPPPRNLNPTGDKAVQKGIDGYKKPGTR